MIELAINGWILSVPGIVQVEKYIYTIEAVDHWLIKNHIDELQEYVNSREVGFGERLLKEWLCLRSASVNLLGNGFGK